MPQTVLEPVMTPAARRILAAAEDLFYLRGIHAVGVDLVAETAGTTKKTLYDRFGSKEGLVTAYLEARRARWQEFVDTHVEAATAEGATGVDRVVAVLDALEEWTGGLRRGCGFVNAWAELGGTEHSAERVVQAEKDAVRSLYERVLREEGLVADGDVEQVATWVHLVHEGALVRLTAGGDPSAIDDARAAVRRLLA